MLFLNKNNILIPLQVKWMKWTKPKIKVIMKEPQEQVNLLVNNTRVDSLTQEVEPHQLDKQVVWEIKVSQVNQDLCKVLNPVLNQIKLDLEKMKKGGKKKMMKFSLVVQQVLIQ